MTVSHSGWGNVVARPRGRWAIGVLCLASVAFWASTPEPAAPPRPACGTPAKAPAPADEGFSIRYDGLSAVLVHPRDEAQLEFVVEVAHDVWTDSWGLRGMVVVVDRAGIETLRGAGLEVEVQIEDIQIAADEERARLQQAEVAKPGNWFAEYKRFEAVDAYVGQLAQQNPDLASIRTIGKSVEGRPLRALTITRPSSRAADKTKIVLNGGQHAREWIAVMTTTCIADRLIRRAGTDDRVARALDQHEFVIVPVVNPDGYVYSWDKDRYWRKNRGGRHGVDLNRNWDWAWGERGSSKNSRSQIYAGPRPFSEPETQALRDLIIEEKPVAHVDLHSFSQLILYPWNHKKKAAPDKPRLSGYADRMATAIFRTHGKSYKAIAGADLYAAGGTFSDWSYGDQGVASFVFELRPARGNGFVLPPEEIVPTCDESFNAVLELSEAVE